MHNCIKTYNKKNIFCQYGPLNMTLISMTLIITVELFVTMALIARGQTTVIMVKIGAIVSVSVKNVLACINTLHPWV